MIDAMGSDLEHGLTQADAGARLSRFGPNQIASEKPPSVWAVSLQQLRDPMNLMLVAVVTVSVLIGELPTAAIVVVVNVVNVALEPGDFVPVDGRIIRSSSLEVQEAALTVESAPVAKAAGPLPDKDIAVGDRANVLFQNTSVTRGTATVVVTETPTAATRPAGSGRRCSRRSPSRSLRSCSSCWPPRPPSCKAAS